MPRHDPATLARRVGLRLAAAVAMLLSACAAAGRDPTVALGAETLIGLHPDAPSGVSSFLGIPYAAAPTGLRRWSPPAPLAPRAGPRRVQQFAPACYQDSGNAEWYQRVAAAFGADPDVITDPPISEDCLYLNVWTPDLHPRARLPVMVWIHGGGNVNGASFDPNYDGARLAGRGGVVVVSIAYRLGVFGFLSHPELLHAPAPANFGLLDQIAALRWVREHIGSFGGDPGNVTLFGESAGAADIGYLLSSPLAEGLFQRAISESGGYLLQETATLADAAAAGRALAQALRGAPDLAALRRRPALEILAAAKSTLGQHDFGPVPDGVTVTAAPASALARHGVTVDLLIGSNENEDYMYVDGDPDGLASELAALPEAARPALAALVAGEPDVRRARDRLWTLVSMRCPSYLLAASAASRGHQSWVYRFSRVRAGPGGTALLAYHGAEIPYVFDTHDPWLPTGPEDRRLTEAMLGYWARFARSGNPNAPGLPAWPAFAGASPESLELGDAIRAEVAPDAALCRASAPRLYPGVAP